MRALNRPNSWNAKKTGRRADLPFRNVIRIVVGFLLAFMVLPGPSIANQENAPLLARDYKMAGDAVRTRIVLHFNREPEVDWFLLRSPHRLVVDLPTTEFAIDKAELEPQGLVTKVRYGRMDEQRSRMIFAVDGSFTIEDLKVLKNESDPGYRLIVDIVADSEAAFEAAMRERISEAPETAAGNGEAVAETTAKDDLFTVVIDPGHGGIDGGATGIGGTLEKTITLVFALELRERLQETGDYKVVLTRESDVFLRLDERVQVARRHEADLLLSIHADSIRMRNFRGATVYTLSDNASDARAAATAARENLSDSLAGFVVKEDAGEVTDILMDLTRRETNAFSNRFARTLVGELDDSLHLVNHPLRSAGFQVLRAPDVPSVLLELGYLSNPQDEKQLRDAEWRAEAIDKVTEAIAAFARVRAGG